MKTLNSLLKSVSCVLLISQLTGLQAFTNTVAAAPLAMGYGKLTYPLPLMGSYQLPSLGKAADGDIIDQYGNKASLHHLFEGKYSVLSFIYSNCSDVNGCPLATNVNYKLKIAMQSDPQLANKLNLFSLSFDPARDTPEVMRLYGENFKYAGKKGNWNFLTTSTINELNPILEAYSQDIQREKSVNGDQSEEISHLLRVFLIDPEFRIRNIYSVGFLHADLIINDVKTLLMASEATARESNSVTHSLPVSSLSRPGDDKQGYANTNYTTHSKALTQRSEKGKSTDLLSIAHNPPLGLPALPAKLINSLTQEKIALGRLLFFDRRLSLNDTFSCAMCHVPEQGFTSNEVSMAIGIEGRSVRRNSPTIFNIAYATLLFHDGRENNLEQQVWGPLLAKNEMGNPSIGHVVEKIRNIKGYSELFDQAFDGAGINMLSIGAALASYQRSLLSADSAFDRWYYAGQRNSLSHSAKQGFQLFTGKALCSSCHSVTKSAALFTDNQLHNTGIGYRETMGIKPDTQRLTLAPGIFVDVKREIIDTVGESPPADLGLYEITENPFDRWKYKTPTLRNVALTAPYMHNGSLGTLTEVVQFYNQGGVKNELLDANIKPLNLTEQEINNLVEFMQSLTGSNVDRLVADAFSVPVGDLTHADPNWANKQGLSNDQ